MAQSANFIAPLAPKVLPPTQTWWDTLLRNRAAMISSILMLAVLLLALIGPALYQGVLPAEQRHVRDGVYQDYNAINATPDGLHWLGADYLGRDVLTRLLEAVRVSLLVALVVEMINIGLGGLLGLMAGFFGGWVDAVISRAADIFFAFPGLLLAILVSAVFGSAAREAYGGTGRLLLVAAALSFVSWPLMARLVRSETLSVKARDFVVAAKGLGASPAQIILRHILPNVAWLIVIAATLDVASVIVNEATLSLLGLGIEEPGASLGLMIFRAVSKIERYPLQVFIPALVITGLVLAFSFLGDGLRDALDPRSRG
jgi:ABC-type dipeptide/oligopeptide/nickel transport system permease subunit